MVPSSIYPPQGYQPLLLEVVRGIYELANAYEGSYRFFCRGAPALPSGLEEARRATLRRIRPSTGDAAPTPGG